MRKRSSLNIAFVLAIGLAVVLGLVLKEWNAGVSMAAAAFVIFAATGPGAKRRRPTRRRDSDCEGGTL